MNATTYRGDMPEPGGLIDEDALVMGETELNATEEHIRYALQFIRAQYIDLMTAGRTLEAKSLLAQALGDHPLL